ncbi:MAG: diacylglycerol kinase family protein [Cocleimonas sp.]
MWQVIINPSAGNGKAGKQWKNIEAALIKANITFKVNRSERALHCTEIAKLLIEHGTRKLIGIGGDGTNHEIINGLMQQNIVPTNEVVYGFIPVGTGNDWVKTHNIPMNIIKAVAIIKAGKTTLQDIGLAKYYRNNQPEQRYFVNVAGMAYDAYITQESNRTNALHYYLLIFKCLFEYVSKQARIVLDGKEVANQHFYTINIGLCKYSGGGMQFVPHAEIDDGQFAISYVNSIPKLKVIASTHYLYGGKIAKFKDAKLYKAKHMKVEAVDDAPTLLELDGEFVGETPVEFEVIPKALKVIVGK